MAKQKTTRYKGITRVDRAAGRHSDGRRITATHGYFVRVTWKGETYRKFFSDSVYGDRLGALEAAKDWRLAKEAEVGKPRSERQVIGIPHTETGIVGIRKIVSGPWGHEAYEANWVNPDGSIGRTSYSINKNGKRKALKLAIEARNRGEALRQNSKFDGRSPGRRLGTAAAGATATPQEQLQPQVANARAKAEWPENLDPTVFEPPAFSLPTFDKKKELRIDDYDGM